MSERGEQWTYGGNPTRQPLDVGREMMTACKWALPNVSGSHKGRATYRALGGLTAVNQWVRPQILCCWEIAVSVCENRPRRRPRLLRFWAAW